MADLVYGVSNFERQRGDFPSLPVVNMLAEDVPVEPGVTLQSRPALLETSMTWGSGPVKGIFKADGVLGNSLFGVSAGSLYRDDTLIGFVGGSGHVSFAGYEDYLFINAGDKIWAYGEGELSSIDFPDDAAVSKVVVGASRLIAVRKDTGKFYWSDPLGITIDALSFATAENSPDTLQDILYLGDRAVLFGAETIEFWPATTDSEVPFAPLPGATLPVGIKETGLAIHFNRTFAWVTNYDEICVGAPDNIISDPELQVKIQNSTRRALWKFYVDANEYLAIRLDGETWVYGARSQVWSEFKSKGHSNWVPRCYAGGYFGSGVDGRVLEWDETGHLDLGESMERGFRAWLPLTNESLKVSNITLRTNPGTTPYITGSHSDPVVELRTSRDGGHEWQPWKQRNLGYQGQYRKKVRWNSLGQFGYPGLLVDIRVSSPVPFRISGLAYNEPFGGR